MITIRQVINYSVNAFIVIMGLLIIYWGLQILFGGSPTFEQFHFGITLAILSMLFYVNRELGELKTAMKYSFKHIASDIAEIKKRL